MYCQLDIVKRYTKQEWPFACAGKREHDDKNDNCIYVAIYHFQIISVTYSSYSVWDIELNLNVFSMFYVPWMKRWCSTLSNGKHWNIDRFSLVFIQIIENINTNYAKIYKTVMK